MDTRCRLRCSAPRGIIAAMGDSFDRGGSEGNYESSDAWSGFDSTGGGNDEWLRLKPTPDLVDDGEEPDVEDAGSDEWPFPLADDGETGADPTPATTLDEWLWQLPPSRKRAVAGILRALALQFHQVEVARAEARLRHARDHLDESILVPRGKHTTIVPSDYPAYAAFYERGEGEPPPAVRMSNQEKIARLRRALRS